MVGPCCGPTLGALKCPHCLGQGAQRSPRTPWLPPAPLWHPKPRPLCRAKEVGGPFLGSGTLQALEEDLGGSFKLSLPFSWGILAAGMPGLSLSIPQPSPRCVTALGSHVCWKLLRSPSPAAPSTRQCHQPRPRLAGLEQPAAP